jgi:DNA/RNA endonuclease G (NUC1)
MRIRTRTAALTALLLVFASCSDTGPVNPAVAPTLAVATTETRTVWISEIHYDNVGIDAGEAIEISGPGGTDLTGWDLVLYNGSGGAVYRTAPLTGAIPGDPAACGAIVVTFPQDGIQNGAPDGVALVDGNDGVIEFVSYEGDFDGVGGPAHGIRSADIGVAEGSGTPVGHSVQRNEAGGWDAPRANGFGTCNGRPSAPPPPPPPPGDLPPTRIVELHYDDQGEDEDEALELEGPAGTDLTGWSVVLYNGNGGAPYDTRMLAGSIAASCGQRGVVVLEYPVNGIQNGGPDGIALVNAAGDVVEFLSYEGTFTATAGPAAGLTARDIGVQESGTMLAGNSLRRLNDGAWQQPATATFGACHGDGVLPPPGPRISFSGRLASDPALPIGFQDQLFATLLDPAGGEIPTAFTWSSDTPEIASIDQRGVMTALAAGTAIVRATAAAANGGTTRTFSLPTRIATASTTALYAGNAEFGEPADADAGDDFIVRYEQFTASYNRNRGTPNWVSYDIDATHFGPEDRCDCFTFDPSLPAGFTRYTTADYTGAGAFHGFGIDRGHLARSFDRTAGSLDNARTFYFTNIIPQAADLNQGPWADLESALGDSARIGNREVYVVTGVAGSKGTVKDEGTITIPAMVWKVALILPRDQGLSSLDDAGDLANVSVISVVMPNEPGVRNEDWRTFTKTVDEVEAASGYDLLALLNDQVEIALESGTGPPVARTDGPYASAEGSAITISAAASSDPDGDHLTYAWNLGDGSTSTGVALSHTYVQDGSYTITLVATDSRGLTSTTTTTAVVSNVVPVVARIAGATLFPGEAYHVAGSFIDPGADAWTATVGYGDGSPVQPLALIGTSFTLSHVYVDAGSFAVTVRVSDDDATSAGGATVTVLTPAQGVKGAIAIVDALVAASRLTPGHGRALAAQLEAAATQLERSNATTAVNVLDMVLRELELYARLGRLSSVDATALRTTLERVRRSAGLQPSPGRSPR